MSSPDSSPTPLPTLTSKPAYLKAVTYAGVTVLEGTTPWCTQCKAIAPEVHKLAAEYPDVHFYTYDVEQTPDIAHELGVSHMPTFSVFKDGDYVDSVRGAKVKEIRRAVEEAR